jgi:N-acetylated-alpha-linked acidic dipeptidase
MLDEAKAMGDLLKTGWKPKRTIVYCSWDGEEPSLIGSTEFAEDHAKELQQKAVVYINSDSNGRGFLSAEGSHALEGFMTEIEKDVTDPQTKVSVYDRDKARELVNASSVKGKKELLDRKTVRLGALGSGSDYSAFLQHLGITTLDLGFGGEDPSGDYHSIYDSYDSYVRFKDHDFMYGPALASVAGRATLRMADADVLPFDFRSLYSTIDGYSKEVQELAEQMRASTAMNNSLIKSNQYTLAYDPDMHLPQPEIKSEVPTVDFSALKTALESLKQSTDKLGTEWEQAAQSGKDQDKLNQKLYRAEQQLLSTEGLPRRPWFKHTIYAPGFYTGYGVKTLPGIRESIEQRNWPELQQQIAIAAKSITQLATYLG